MPAHEGDLSSNIVTVYSFLSEDFTSAGYLLPGPDMYNKPHCKSQQCPSA